MLLTNEVSCLLLPPELSYVDGAFIACQASTAYGAMLKLNPSGRDTLVVFGLGPVGLCGVMIARALSAQVVDAVEERLELARDLGASAVIDGVRDDVVAQLQALADGEGPNLAFETSGSAVAHQHVLDALCKGGRAAFVGIGARDKTANLTQIVAKQLTLMGSFVSPIGMYWELAAFLVRHRIPLQAMVTHRFGIADAPEAFRLVDSARTGKVIFE